MEWKEEEEEEKAEETCKTFHDIIINKPSLKTSNRFKIVNKNNASSNAPNHLSGSSLSQTTCDIKFVCLIT